MPYANENRLTLKVNKNTTPVATLIAAPGAGKRICIDFLYLNPSGGANNLTLTGEIALPTALNDNQVLQLSNDIHAPLGIFPVPDNTALTLAQSQATTVEGYIIYRIQGQ